MINPFFNGRLKISSIMFYLFIMFSILFSPLNCEAHPILPEDVLSILQNSSTNISNPTTISIDPGINTYRNIPLDATEEDQAKSESEFIKNSLKFIKLGIFHIFTGYDHILFLIAIILTFVSIKSIFKLVTTFTLAHSVTLILSGTNILSLSSKIVEPIIALSISYVALTSVFFKKIRIGSTKNKIIAIFIFGLFHGLGFAGILKEIKIPKDMFLSSLLFFNLGVEIGQLAILTLIVPIIYYLKRTKHNDKIIKIIALMISILGIFWVIKRIFSI